MCKMNWVRETWQRRASCQRQRIRNLGRLTSEIGRYGSWRKEMETEYFDFLEKDEKSRAMKRNHTKSHLSLSKDHRSCVKKRGICLSCMELRFHIWFTSINFWWNRQEGIHWECPTYRGWLVIDTKHHDKDGTVEPCDMFSKWQKPGNSYMPTGSTDCQVTSFIIQRIMKTWDEVTSGC